RTGFTDGVDEAYSSTGGIHEHPNYLKKYLKKYLKNTFTSFNNDSDFAGHFLSYAGGNHRGRRGRQQEQKEGFLGSGKTCSDYQDSAGQHEREGLFLQRRRIVC